MAYKVLVHIVTFNSEKTIISCLTTVTQQQDFQLNKDFFLVVTDNASTDKTCQLIQAEFGNKLRLIQNSTNSGFAKAHNSAIKHMQEFGCGYLFVLNPDVGLKSDCLSLLVQRLAADSRAGICCPKLYRCDESLNPLVPPQLDSTGIYITPTIRHFDRNAGETEDLTPVYENDEYVFGATGAAMLLRKNFIEDVALPRPTPSPDLQLFDELFFAYREDADLAWRAQRLGWKCRYVPSAIGYHVRHVTPERRDILSPEINAYGVRNRFLLQLNNYSWKANFKCLIPALYRNLLVIIATLTKETTSLPALKSVIYLAPRALRNRRYVLKHTRVRESQIGRWFKFIPYSEPALTPSISKTQIRSLQVVIVNYNSGDRLNCCVRALRRAEEELRSKLTVKVTIVDNDSKDDSLSFAANVASTNSAFDIVHSTKNLGFAGAINNVIFKNDADAYLILNPDIVINADSINHLISTLDRYTDLAIVAPVLTDEHQQPQFGFTARMLPTLGSTLCELFFLHQLWPDNPWTTRYLLKQERFIYHYLARTAQTECVPFESLERPLLVEQPAGACMLIRGKDIKAISGFDTQFWPAWFEDVDFCKRILDHQKLCAIDSQAKAIHEGGYSLEHLKLSGFAQAWYPNLLRYWKKHGTSLEFSIIRILLPIALLTRSVICILKAKTVFKGSAKEDEQLAAAKTLFRLAIGI